MPSAMVGNSAVQSATPDLGNGNHCEAMKQVLGVVDKKVRNMEKKKVSLMCHIIFSCLTPSRVWVYESIINLFCNHNDHFRWFQTHCKKIKFIVAFHSRTLHTGLNWHDLHLLRGLLWDTFMPVFDYQLSFSSITNPTFNALSSSCMSQFLLRKDMLLFCFFLSCITFLSPL